MPINKSLIIIPLIASTTTFATPMITNMHNHALQKEINKVEQVNFDPSLKAALKIWKKKENKIYHSSQTGFTTYKGKHVYDLIHFAMARENQRLSSSKKEDNSIVIPLTNMLQLLEKTTKPSQCVYEARMLFSQALMLEEIRLYHVHYGN